MSFMGINIPGGKQSLSQLSAVPYEDWLGEQTRGMSQSWDETTGQMRYYNPDEGGWWHAPVRDYQGEYAKYYDDLVAKEAKYNQLLGQVPYTDREHYWPQLTGWLAQNAPGNVGGYFRQSLEMAQSGKGRNTKGEPEQLTKLYNKGTPQERAFMEQYGLNTPEVQQALINKLSKSGVMYTKNKDPLGLKIMQSVVGGIITGGLGAALSPAVGAATGLGAQASSGLAGAGIGGLTSYATGGNPLLGAVAGGIGGYYNPEVSGILGGTGGAGTTAGAAGTTAATGGTSFANIAGAGSMAGPASTYVTGLEAASLAGAGGAAAAGAGSLGGGASAAGGAASALKTAAAALGTSSDVLKTALLGAGLGGTLLASKSGDDWASYPGTTGGAGTGSSAADPLALNRDLYQAKLNELAAGGPDVYGFGQYQKGALGELTDGYHKYYETALQRLTEDPTYLENLGAYKFALGQGTQAINRKAAALGTSLGTGTAKDLGTFASGLASQTYFDMYKGLQGSLGTAYQGLGAKLGGYGDLASKGLAAYQGQLGAMKGLTEGSALETAKLQSLERISAEEQATKRWIAENTKQNEGSGWGTALGALAGGAMGLWG